MEFQVNFYRTASGDSPVAQFLANLRKSDREGYAGVVSGLKRLQDSKNHGEPLTKSLGGGLFEMRQIGKVNTRIFWFFVVGKRIIAVHGIRKKSQAISENDLACARARMQDWLERNAT